jgi:hypothetical protein
MRKIWRLSMINVSVEKVNHPLDILEKERVVVKLARRKIWKI